MRGHEVVDYYSTGTTVEQSSAGGFLVAAVAGASPRRIQKIAIHSLNQ